MSNLRQLLNPHQHGDSSIDGASTVEQIVVRSKELGATHVCLTDHGNLNGVMDLYKTCKEHGVKPIFGIELYLESPFKDELLPYLLATVPLKGSGKGKSKEGKGGETEQARIARVEKMVREAYVHLTVHLKDEWAYKYFCTLTPKMESRAIVRWGERKPMITWDELAGAAGHITVCSSCMVGAVQKWILPRTLGVSRPDLAEKVYCQLRELVGPDNFFVEAFPHAITHEWQRPEKDAEGRITKRGMHVPHECNAFMPDGDLQKPLNQFVIQMARKYGDPILISLDAHFAKPEQKVIQDAKIGNGQENWVMYNSLHIMSTEEAARNLKATLGVTDRDIEEWVENSYRWGAKFDSFKIQTSKDRWVLESLGDDYMKQLKAAIDKYGRMDWSNRDMIARLQKEISILVHNGTVNLLSYFFTIEDMADFCRRNDILMNVRGSAGGSLLLYLLNVSAVNPLEYDLSFERFLTAGRIKANTLPDVDIDVSMGDRDILLEYLEKKYGDRFCQISIDTMLKLRSSIKDAERAITGRVSPETEAMLKTFPLETSGTDSKALALGYQEGGAHVPGLVETNPKLKEYAQKNHQVWSVACEMMGIQRQKSVHACGTVIADRPVQEYCPVTYIKGTRVTGFSPKSIETAGLVKYDILGLKTLKWVQECLNALAKDGVVLDFSKLPYDEVVVDEFVAGRTETVFQFDTETVRPYLMQIMKREKCGDLNSVIECLAAVTSLCRPGCLDAPTEDGRTLAEVYVATSNGEQVRYIHQDMAQITGITNGIQIYQEQTINIFKKLVGYSDEQSETVRRGIGKKINSVLESCMADLKVALLGRGWTEAQAEMLQEQIMASARYSFNKSHAVSYAKVAYACMYLKTNHPLHWWKAVLSHSEKEDVAGKYWKHVRSLVLLPEINKSSGSFEISGEKLVAPLSIITGVGEKAYEQLVGGRPYKDLKDFVARHYGKKGQDDARNAVHSGITRKLIATGVLDGLFEARFDTILSKLGEFERVKAEVKEEKQEPVPDQYIGITSLGLYMLRKEVMPVYSEDVSELLLGNRPSYKDEYGRRRLARRGAQQHGVPVMTGDEILTLKSRVADKMGLPGKYACVAYVMEEKVFQYSNKTKSATKMMVDVGGELFEEVLWPAYGQSNSLYGYKGLPVLLEYSGTMDRFDLRKVVRLLDKSWSGSYNVV